MNNYILDLLKYLSFNLSTELHLKKLCYYCKNCHNTFISETTLVEKNKNISNNLNFQIRLNLIEKSIENFDILPSRKSKDCESKSVYNVYHSFLHSISKKDFNKFKKII